MQWPPWDWPLGVVTWQGVKCGSEGTRAQAASDSHISEKEHLSVVTCGHVVSGKSTTTGRLLFEVGGVPERELDKLKQEAEHLEKSSFALTFYMDRQEEWERGVDIACTTKEFFTDKWHYIIIDAPGHRDSIKNMMAGESQADVALTMVSADGKFHHRDCQR